MKMMFRVQMTKNHHMLNSLRNSIGIDLLWRQKGIIFFWTNAYKNGHCGQAGNVLWVHAALFFCTFDGYFCILYVCSQLELYQGHLREQSTRIKTFSVSLMINMFDIELKFIFLQKKSVCMYPRLKIWQSSIWYGETMGRQNDRPIVWWSSVYFDRLSETGSMTDLKHFKLH